MNVFHHAAAVSDNGAPARAPLQLLCADSRALLHSRGKDPAMTREEVALRIFCAIINRLDEFELYPALGEKQIRTSFHLADVFLKVSGEAQGVDAGAK